MPSPHGLRLPASITSLAVHPDGRSIACATADGSVHLVDADLSVLWSARHGTRWSRATRLASVAFSPRGDLVATGAHDGSTMTWRVADGRPSRRITFPHTDSVVSSAFSPDGRTLAIAHQSGYVVAWDVEQDREVGRMDHGFWATGVEYDAAGSFIATVGYDRSVRVWRADDLTEVWRVPTPQMAGAVSIAPAGDRLVAGGFGDRAVVLSSDDGAELGALQHRDKLLFARFTPDGRGIVTECLGHVLTLWDAVSHEKLRELQLDGLAVDPCVLPSGDAVAAGFGPELRVLRLVG
ncbi:WD40 repeat domain-containing protein [Cellulomonas sp. zg-ZUI222]|uniref:WD40 repeat domain-containing protein n=1 Tax=Cellulomonas wangleii TaxID=2816956 RepID=A0ABX8D830_9CELL|nr:WD40 repeat domain-containing protein [Cellulomonas wangleii]MBO0920018.1 WD40 repeat domain-containing protein [Cellulomonas wangleii]MBO0923553.1 WD40 repeat domain-containing protein [Cellulomonas wangleii]QVI61887.1 WD40 repeat domain-containing protein [Cellulomonas wangleii]